VKILLVAPQPFYQERGTPIAVRLLAETLCSFGHEVDLLVYHEGDDIEVPRLRIIRAARPAGVIRVPIGISWQKLLCDLTLIARMVGLLFRHRYDVIHAVEEAVFPAAAISLFSRHRLVYDMDSSLSDQLTDKWKFLRPLRGALAMVERAAVLRSHTVLAVCEDLAVKVRPWKHASRVIVLPDVPMGGNAPADVGESLRDIAGGGSVIALYVGNLEKYQGIDLLLDAASRLSPVDRIHVIAIGGNAADVERYRHEVTDRGIAQRVHFLGPRPVGHLGAYLQQADVLLSPRILGQNTPMKVYSYMQSGKAILATDIRSHTQALDRDCAALVAPEPVAFATGLRQLATDVELRERLGSAARIKAEREYSLPVYRSTLQRVYDQIAGS
jgi:glycosyltransferase involved in cell wall biosynthesis